MDSMPLHDEAHASAVETMFRIVSRHQMELVSLADNKANILISVNSIVISVVVAGTVKNIREIPQMMVPIILLVLTCLITIVLAILATRPKISSGTYSREEIEQKKANLLFFGNFFNMEPKEYEGSIKEMIGDYEYLQRSLIRDQYSMGKVLGVKYKLLRRAYTVFMYGMIVSVVAFGIAMMAWARVAADSVFPF